MTELCTPRGERLPPIPWNVHPRPQLRREKWLCLNGPWELNGRTVTVPFCPESRLSGIGEHFPEGTPLVYRRRFSLPEAWQGGRVLLHVDAADQVAKVYVNQKYMGAHVGGYEAFGFDITDALAGENALEITCTDDLRDQSHPYGKQVRRRGGMWYTPVSGIWASVWLEWVPETYVNRIGLEVDLEKAVLTVEPPLEGAVTLDSGEIFPLRAGRAELRPRVVRLWTPESPHLYPFTLRCGEDEVRSYFALRTLETRTLGGVPRLCLNGEPYFFHGLLDQGYWPEGIYTPPAPESYADDILAMKNLGFNTLRKHIKVEPEQFYYDCDRLGMVVFQDMVNNGPYSFLRDTALPTLGLQTLDDRKLHRDPETRRAFLRSMEATVRQLRNHPCICYWTVFNEGWGQFDSDSVYPLLRALDGSRFIDTTSGWFRRSRTDVDSRHLYFTSWKALQPGDKPLVLSEFGGYACGLEGHVFDPKSAFGYRTCKDPARLQQDLEELYLRKVLPAVRRGLCAAIYTQVSDVEDEINGLLTYDRRVCKADAPRMQTLARALEEASRAP